MAEEWMHTLGYGRLDDTTMAYCHRCGWAWHDNPWIGPIKALYDHWKRVHA